MNEPDTKEQGALFWYRVIAPLLDAELDRDARSRRIAEILAKEWTFPDGKRRRISRATLFRKLKDHRELGFKALQKADRSDKGQSRAIRAAVFQKAVELRVEQPRRTTRRVIELTEKALGLEPGTIKLKTLARWFQEKRLTRADLDDETITGFTPFAYQHINQLWMSDVMDGFPVPDSADPRKKRMTYLVSFLDDASRVLPHGEFYFDEKLPRLENTLKKAVARRGVPERLYLDNGKIYHAAQFELICAELGIQKLIYTEPYRPEGHGKIEKWHGFVRGDFLDEARAKGPRSLDELNRWFWAWLEIAYHHKHHDSLGEAPIAFWMRQVDRIRHADPDALESIFLWRENRSVTRIHTLSLCGNEFEVAPELAGQVVEVRFNPFDLSRVSVYRDGVFVLRARPVSLPQPIHPKAPAPPPRPKGPLSMSYLDTLVAQYEQHVAREFGRMDFAKIQEKRQAALETEKGKFVAAIAAHLGRALGSLEAAAARGLYDQLAPFDLSAISSLPQDPVPDAIAFGKFLERLRAEVLSRRGRKGDA